MSEHDESPTRPDWEAWGADFWAAMLRRVENGDPPTKHTLRAGLFMYGVPRASEAARYVGLRLVGKATARPGNPGYPKADPAEVKAFYLDKLADLQEKKRQEKRRGGWKPWREATKLTKERFDISESTVRKHRAWEE